MRGGQQQVVVATPTERPARPRLLRWANAVGRLGTSVGLTVELEPDVLCQRARRATGLDDFGDESFREPLGVLTDALEREANLHPVGRFLARGQLETILGNRLEMEAQWTAAPEILDQDLSRPLIIVGLPRCGTTIIQHTLAVDPANRPLMHWEAGRPCPPPQTATYATDPRIERSRRGTRFLDYAAPGWRAVHAEDPDGPTECVQLFNHSLASPELTVAYRVPSYLEWYLQEDLDPHYAYFKRQLQLLQWRHRRERWLLKSPAHLFGIRSLLRAFPDACVVHLHRHPAEVAASFASLATFMRAVTSDAPTPEEVGRRWVEVWAGALERTMQERSEAADDQFLDVAYQDVVDDPMAVVRRIYAHFDLPLPADTDTAMTAFVSKNGQGSKGVHKYRATEVGVDRDEVSERFARYIDAFGVAPTAPAVRDPSSGR